MSLRGLIGTWVLVSVAVWGVILIVSGSILSSLWELSRNSATTVGIVVAVDWANHNRATYEYRVDGKVYRSEEIMSSLKRDARVRVYYSPRNPAVAGLAEPTSAFREALAGVGALSFLASLGVGVVVFVYSAASRLHQ